MQFAFTKNSYYVFVSILLALCFECIQTRIDHISNIDNSIGKQTIANVICLTPNIPNIAENQLFPTNKTSKNNSLDKSESLYFYSNELVYKNISKYYLSHTISLNRKSKGLWLLHRAILV
jgi:hypothetical protein